MSDKSTRALGLFGALAATFDLVHGAMDQWFQPGWAAVHKRKRGRQLVGLRTGVAIDEAMPAEGDLVVTADTLGRAGTTLHVVTYTVGQLAATIAVTRALGMRVPARALLTGAAVNAMTHWALDRGHHLVAVAHRFGKKEYLEKCTVVRAPGAEPDVWGPGTAGFELDQSAHKVVGWAAALITTMMTIRASGSD